MVFFTETEMSYWGFFYHCLNRKLSKWQLPMQPVAKILSMWYFHFNVSKIVGGNTTKNIKEKAIIRTALYLLADSLLHQQLWKNLETYKNWVNLCSPSLDMICDTIQNREHISCVILYIGVLLFCDIDRKLFFLQFCASQVRVGRRMKRIFPTSFFHLFY